jgi:hypothetical protein
MIVDVAPEALAGGGDAALDLADELERGNIVRFGRCPFALPDEEDLAFLRDVVGERLSRKNVSWYAEDDRLAGLGAERTVKERTRRILRQHADRVRAFLQGAMPEFMRGAREGTTSLRPVESRGRNLSPHASDELVHVDAGAYGATHGDRILRFFVNVNPREERVWTSKGSFRDLYRAHGGAAGVAPRAGQPPALATLLDRARSRAVQLATAAFPALRVVDSSPYDRLMRRFHNYMKDAPAFRDSDEGLVRFGFAPFSAWMVLTDAVSHACISGRHALVSTFIVPLANCRRRELAPFYILAAAGDQGAPTE